VEQPDANATGLLVLMCAEPKDRYVKEWGMKEWPVQGVPWQVHFDNDRKYTSKLIYVGLTQNGIKPTYRPKGQPRYGGILERLFRTVEEKYIHERPGTTKSSVEKRGAYDSGMHADLTINEFTREFALAIDEYHHTLSKNLDGKTPLEEWKRMVSLHGTPRRLSDHDAWRFRVRLLPCVKRTIGKDGIEFFGRKYGSDELDREEMPDAEGNVLVRFDPENTNEIYLFDRRTGDFLAVPALKQTDEPVVLSQWILARHELEHEGNQSPSEEATLERYKERMIRLRDHAVSSRTAARKLESIERRSGLSERHKKMANDPPKDQRQAEQTIEFTPNPTALSGITPVRDQSEV